MIETALPVLAGDINLGEIVLLTREGQRGFILGLPFLSDIPTLNTRKSWQAQLKVKAEWRDTTMTLAKQAKVGNLGQIELALVYLPATNRRRDSDNYIPVMKYCADGLVKAGIIADDTSEFMTRHMPILLPARKLAMNKARLLLGVLQT